MRKFEYKIISTRIENLHNPVLLEETLNKEGNNGWELVNSSQEYIPQHVQNADKSEVFFVFKKEIKGR